MRPGMEIVKECVVPEAGDDDAPAERALLIRSEGEGVSA